MTSIEVVCFGKQIETDGQLWDTSYFFALLFELFDEFKDKSNEEPRQAAFLISTIQNVRFTFAVPVKLIIDVLNYFNNVRLKTLVLLELIPFSESIDCERASILLWHFKPYGLLTLFYILDRIKFVIIDKEKSWKVLFTIFDKMKDKKHAAYVFFDQTNFYKPNQASIIFGSTRLERYF